MENKIELNSEEKFEENSKIILLTPKNDINRREKFERFKEKRNKTELFFQKQLNKKLRKIQKNEYNFLFKNSCHKTIKNYLAN